MLLLGKADTIYAMDLNKILVPSLVAKENIAYLSLFNKNHPEGEVMKKKWIGSIFLDEKSPYLICWEKIICSTEAVSAASLFKQKLA